MGYRLRATVTGDRDALVRLRLVLDRRGIQVTSVERRESQGEWVVLVATLGNNPARAGAAARHLMAEPWVRDVELLGAGPPYYWSRIRVPQSRLQSRWAGQRVRRARWTGLTRMVDVTGPRGIGESAAEELGGRVVDQVAWPMAVAAIETQPQNRRPEKRPRWNSVRR